MRGLRSLLILVLIAGVLGWFVYREQNKPVETGSELERVFAGVERDAIDEITIKSESGEQTTLKKSGDAWQIVQPTTVAADPAETSGLAMNLSTVEAEKIVDENAADLKEYGLATPRIEVRFKAGGKDHVLLIGNKTPPGTHLYAKRANENKVFLIPAHLESTFNRTTFDLRDKAFLKVERDKIDAIEVVAGGKTMQFSKQNGEWMMTAPMSGRGDFSAVETLISRVTGLQMKSAVPATADSKTFGFDKPAASVRLNTGSSQATLLVGASAGEEAVYAKDAGRPEVYTVEAALLDELKKDAGEFRQKDLFDARGFNSTRLEIVRGGQTMVFEKSKGKDKEGRDVEVWRQTSPQQKDVEQSKMDSVLNAITGARATSFAAPGTKTGLENPELTVTIKFDEGKREDRVMFARAGGTAYAQRAGDASAAIVEGSTIDNIIKQLDEVK